jgi:hypothetical protein
MFNYIFYSIGLLIIINLLLVLATFKKRFFVIEWYDKYQKLIGKKPTREEFRSENDYKLFKSQGLTNIIESLWVILGLITPYWYVFLGIIIYGKICKIIFNKIKYNFLSRIVIIQNILIKLIAYIILLVTFLQSL